MEVYVCHITVYFFETAIFKVPQSGIPKYQDISQDSTLVIIIETNGKQD